MILGMILLKTYNDSVSHHELLTQYEHINTIYNGHMNWILIIFGLGLTLVLTVMPYLAHKRLEKDFKEQENKFKADLNALKVELKKEMKEENKKEITKRTNKLNEKIDKKINKVDISSQIKIKHNDAAIKFTHRMFNEAIGNWLQAIRMSIENDIYDSYYIIKKELEDIKDQKHKLRLDIEKIEETIECSIPDFIENIRKQSEKSLTNVIITKTIIDLIEDIIDKSIENEENVTDKTE